MTDPISSVGSVLGLQNWDDSRTRPIPGEPASPQKAVRDGPQHAMLESIQEITFEGLYRCGYVNRGMSRPEMIRVFLGLHDVGSTLNADSPGILGSIKQSIREALWASGFIDHTTPSEEVIRILLGLGSHADDEGGLEMNVPIAVAIAEICATLIQQDSSIAAQLYPSVSLEVLL